MSLAERHAWRCDLASLAVTAALAIAAHLSAALKAIHMAPLVYTSVRNTALLCLSGWQQGEAHGGERSLSRLPNTQHPTLHI